MITEKAKNIRHKILHELEPALNEFDNLLLKIKSNPNSDLALNADKECLTPEFLAQLVCAGIKLDTISNSLRVTYLSLLDYVVKYKKDIDPDLLADQITELKNKYINTCNCSLCDEEQFKENETYYTDLARKLYHDSIKNKGKK